MIIVQLTKPKYYYTSDIIHNNNVKIDRLDPAIGIGIDSEQLMEHKEHKLNYFFFTN